MTMRVATVWQGILRSPLPPSHSAIVLNTNLQSRSLYSNWNNTQSGTINTINITAPDEIFSIKFWVKILQGTSVCTGKEGVVLSVSIDLFLPAEKWLPRLVASPSLSRWFQLNIKHQHRGTDSLTTRRQAEITSHFYSGLGKILMKCPEGFTGTTNA